MNNWNPEHEVSYDGDEQGQDPERLFRPEKQPHLAEDGAPPAHPADDIPHRTPRDHPETDTNVEFSELYDGGIDEATETQP